MKFKNLEHQSERSAFQNTLFLNCFLFICATKRYLPEKEAGESGFAGAGGADYRYNGVRRNLQI
jgi:hypothetical protein